MAPPPTSSLFFLLLLLPLLSAAHNPASINPPQPPAGPALSPNYYDKTCPGFTDTMDRVITEKQTESPTTAAAVVRLFFHDCMVGGCDGSTLISSNAFNKAERDADPNLSLPGDAFDLVTRAKTALELECPGTVSCSDILAVSARDLVRMVGGPYYPVRLGRRDGLTSLASRVDGNIAYPNMTLTHIISMFESKGFTVREMVALVGAHTIGFSHCGQFSDRIYHFSKESESDPAINPKYARELRRLCANYTRDPAMAAFNDVITPGKFDNMYYKNLERGLGLLATDQGMAEDPRTRLIVEEYANDEGKFFEDFGKAMVKVSEYEVKTGKSGDVRRRCDQFNEINVDKVSG